MRPKWLAVLVVLLILLSWASVFAGPKGQFGHGDDDIPELMKPRTSPTLEKLVDSLDVESVWNAIFRVDRGKLQELSRELDANRARVPATRRYPVKMSR